MTKIYIAGPMTGLPDFNYPAFFEAAEWLEKMGHEPINPATLPECDERLEGIERWAWYMRRALPLVAQAEELCVLPGWGTSRGARLEIHIAQQLRMRIKHFVNGELRDSILL